MGKQLETIAYPDDSRLKDSLRYVSNLQKKGDQRAFDWHGRKYWLQSDGRVTTETDEQESSSEQATEWAKVKTTWQAVLDENKQPVKSR